MNKFFRFKVKNSINISLKILLDVCGLGLDSVLGLISTNSISESLSSLSFFGRNLDLLTAILGFLLNDLIYREIH